MSGIINSAGSRSGIIGTTELDYEEGTFTPVFVASSTTFSLGTQTGLYTKVGNVVHYQLNLVTNAAATGVTGTIGINGLPFANAGCPSGTVFGQIYNVNFHNSAFELLGRIGASATGLALYWVLDDGVDEAITAGYFGADDLRIICSGTYLVA